MVEITVLKYLENLLSGIPVYAEMPEEMTDTFVIIEKTGSSRENHINAATIAVQSYAPTMYEAAALNETVKTFMDALPIAQQIFRWLDDYATVFRCKLNSDYNYTDTSIKRYRYQAVYDITY